jgi:hypothetical protein
MDWVTLTRDDVENDRLPRLCVHCGRPATDVSNTTFEWCPDWVGLTYLLGIFPGVILQGILGKKMRVSLPVCEGHRGLKATIVLVAALGWLVIPGVLGGLGTGVAALIGSLVRAGWPEWTDLAWGFFPGLGVGFLVWLVWLIRLASLQIQVVEITDEGIQLRGLAHDFVMAVKAKAASVALVEPAPRFSEDSPRDQITERQREWTVRQDV